MEAGGSNGGRRGQALWIGIGALVLLAVALWIWKGVAVDRTRERMEERATEQVAERTEAVLGLAAQSLGLAVREAAIAGDAGRIQSYLDRLVQEPGVDRIVYAAGDTVRLSTDRSLAGRPLESLAPGAARAESPTVARVEGGWRAIVPITGLNERLGTLVLDWRPAREGGS